MRANCCKFALMDGVILIAAFALGIYFATDFMRTESDGRFDTNAQPCVDWAVGCVLWSGVIAGPLILLGQRFRGRRSRLSWGEWLWLAPLSLYLLVYVFQQYQQSDGPRLVLVVFAVLIQCMLSFAAFLWLVKGLFGTRLDVACRWTDFLGCLVCMTVGPVIIYGLNQALSQL
jgi:hypothetical protein